ncbi:expressed unknown protein [Seminavis robusta]|uniref:Glycosyltransferase family 92 protein n=1 Tax=Seminavis robusta TaxID=568900 RepID=A0A9N8EVV0_9STRA|nr:expressed unknown protein [Seminavis robusta]|eukprot:Sro1760_g295840.1 n/a (635) ;mRNA; f:7546-9544
MMRDQARDVHALPSSSPGGDNSSSSPRSMVKAAYYHRVVVFALLVLAVVTMMSSTRQMVVSSNSVDQQRYLALQDAIRNNATNSTTTGSSHSRTVHVISKKKDPDYYIVGKKNLSGFPNDNDKLPGRFMQNKMHILGTRLTTSYDKFDESVSFDMFGHAMGGGASEGFYNIAKLSTNGAFTFREASQQKFYCHLHEPGQQHPARPKPTVMDMEYMPTHHSIDRNTWNSHLIWRCNISPYLSKSQLLERTHVRVSVFPQMNKHHPNATIPLFTVDVPIETGSVGYGGPLIKSPNTGSFVETIARDGPIGVILCVAGVKESALWMLPEWIQHHLNIGVDHIFMGADTPEEMRLLQQNLAYYIDRGVLVLGGEDTVMPEREIRKMRFYDQCLYHAKGMSEYVVNWDVDELWIPPILADANLSTSYYRLPGTNETHRARHYERRHSRVATDLQKEDELLLASPYQSTMSLIEAVRSLQGKDGCSDWCYQTFPSYTIVRTEPMKENATHPQLKGYYGFPVREAKLNYQWQKPIIRTKYAHQSSFHLGGSCARGNSHTMKDNKLGETIYKAQFLDCPLIDKERDDSLGRMHHYYALFRKNWGEIKMKDYPNRDEYTYKFRRTVIQQLEALQDKIQAAVDE